MGYYYGPLSYYNPGRVYPRRRVRDPWRRGRFDPLGAAFRSRETVVPTPDPTPLPGDPPRDVPPFVVRGPLPIDEDTLRAVRTLWLAAGEVTPVPLIDEDTLQAVRARWVEDMAQLPQLFDRPIESGRLKHTDSHRLTFPYAHLACVFARREQAGAKTASGTRAPWFDWREVTITVWGSKAQVVEAAQAILAVFNLDTELAYPSGDRFLQWRPDNEISLEQDETTKDGQDVWRVVLKALVWSVRTV